VLSTSIVPPELIDPLAQARQAPLRLPRRDGCCWMCASPALPPPS